MVTESAEALECSLGVIAYNEAGNITALLESLCAQKLRLARIAEIIVVSSASTDGTDELVEEFSRHHSQVRLIRQPSREGKSSAINLFLAAARAGILAVISGDVVPAADAIEKLVAPFADPRVGATGGRPLPENDPRTFTGYAVQLLWRLHHRMALLSPKLGEMIVFRRLMDSIPTDSAVDEASIEAIVRRAGLKLRYIPEAVIHNQGPRTLRDFVKQRRRIQNGHLWLARQEGYKVASQDGRILLWVLLRELAEHPLQAPKTLAVMAVEAYARLLGSYDYKIKGKNPFAWDIAHSAKRGAARSS